MDCEVIAYFFFSPALVSEKYSVLYPIEGILHLSLLLQITLLR